MAAIGVVVTGITILVRGLAILVVAAVVIVDVIGAGDVVTAVGTGTELVVSVGMFTG